MNDCDCFQVNLVLWSAFCPYSKINEIFSRLSKKIKSLSKKIHNSDILLLVNFLIIHEKVDEFNGSYFIN